MKNLKLKTFIILKSIYACLLFIIFLFKYNFDANANTKFLIKCELLETPIVFDDKNKE